MIGYYIHHQGLGHLARADALAAACDEPVVALSSLAPPPDSHFAGWLQLPPDPALERPDDPRAGGALHWAPLDSWGYHDRMASLASWVARARPRLVVVDVSVEVTALLRLLAVPVVVVAGAGHRTDDVHTLGYRMAAHIVAPWPAEADVAGQLATHRGKTTWIGAVSRFDHLVPEPPPGDRSVLLLLGSGGHDIDVPQVAAAQDATPEWRWTPAGWPGSAPVVDVWAALQAADVVVTHAGQGALAEVAAARRPAVVLPQQRPFDEQRATATHLRAAGLAVVHDTWPPAHEWPGLLQSAAATDGDVWARWNDRGGAQRFARCLAGVASEAPGVG